MADTDLGPLFGKIKAALNDITDLEKPVNTPPGTFEKGISLDTGNQALKVFDTPVTIDATLEAKVSVLAAGAVPDSPFGASPLTIADGQQYTSLTIGGKISASGKVDTNAGVLAISANASAKTSFSYAHLLPVAGGTKRIDAFRALATNTTLPQAVDVTKLRAGEVLDFAADLNVDFGLKASFQSAVDIKEVITFIEDIGGGFSAPFTAHIGFSASAAVGFSLYESTHVTAAKAATTNPGWVRIRLERAHRSRIAFGITTDLSIAYDATAGPQALLDKIFSIVSNTKVMQTVAKVDAALKKVPSTPQEWAEFKTKITGEAATIVTRLVNDSKWMQAAEASKEVQDFVKLSNTIVKAYDGIDAKVQSIIEDVLARFDAAGLAKVKPIIDKIASFDLASFKIESLLSKDASEVVHWIEVLTGQDIEELLISGKIKDAVQRAKDAATQIQKFLGGIETNTLAEIHKLLDQTGAKGVVDWLRTNATSVANLQAKADSLISDFVTRIVGKELDKITDADLAKISAFAAKLDAVLSAPATLQAMLQAKISMLKGTIGFSSAAEISRVSEWSAIVDVEIDPSNGDVVAASKRILTGKFADFLSALNGIRNHPFVIHEILLTSRRVRTSSATTVAAFLGFDLAEQEAAINQSTVAVKPGDIREALYEGGATVRRKLNDKTGEGAAWIRIAAKGSGVDIRKPYDDAQSAIRLTYAVEDLNADDKSKSRDSFRRLLGALSFASAIGSIPAKEQVQTRYSLEVEFGEDAVTALKKDADESGWNGDNLKGAGRWFGDVDCDAQQAAVMTNIVTKNAAWAQLWTSGFVGGVSDKFFQADEDGKFLGVVGARLIEGNKQFKVEFEPLQQMMSHRSDSFGHFKDFNLAKATTSTDPKDLNDAARQGSDLFHTGQTGCAPPLFNFWFVLARLLRLEPGVFDGARATATIRSRKNAQEDWPAPQIFAMEKISIANLFG